MKLPVLILFTLLHTSLWAQQQSFDITTFTPPRGWKKQADASSVQFAVEDAAKGTYCLIQLLKSVPGTSNAKTNFDAAWENVVKEIVTVSGKPEMQPAAKDGDWEAISGYSTFESGEQKGIVMLVTTTGFSQMVNVMILTNTDVYEKEITDFLGSVDFKKPAASGNQPHVQANKPAAPAAAKKDGFAFNTTNFDDGWTSTVQEDWVEVTRGNTKVLIHYPNQQADQYNSVLMDGLKNAWNILVAPRYSSGSNFEFKPVSGWQSVAFAEADLVEKHTGKKVHVVLFKMHYSNGSGKYMEFITADKAAYEREFGPYRQESYGWEKVEQMANYNKFAVAQSDLRGKWTSNFTGLTQYVNVYTGLSAGATSYSSSVVFEFGSGNSYKWSLGSASGVVGNLKFQSGRAAGKFSMTGNWLINFSDIEGRPKKYNAYFSCIKGARILWLQDTEYGSYTGYGKSE